MALGDPINRVTTNRVLVVTRFIAWVARPERSEGREP